MSSPVAHEVVSALVTTLLTRLNNVVSMLKPRRVLILLLQVYTWGVETPRDSFVHVPLETAASAFTLSKIYSNVATLATLIICHVLALSWKDVKMLDH